MENGEKISFLLENGMSSDEIRRYLSDGISLDELITAAESCIANGVPISEDEYPSGAPIKWDAPKPFANVITPDFPIEALPGPMASFVESLAESTQTPTEMAGVLALGVLATALQSKFDVQVTPDWKEPLCLYTVAVAPPGERKSAVISALTRPLQEWEAERREQEAEAVEQNRIEREYLEKSRAAATTAAVKKPSPEAKAKMMDLSAQLASFKDMRPYRLIVDDVTTEKLMDMLDEQGGCLTVSSAEGGIFDAMAGRYDRSANFDVYLKGHAGDMIVVDRIGRKPNCVPHPRLSMLLTIQPDVLQGLMGNATFKGRGLCGRFMYAVCKSKVGHRNITPEPIPDDVKRNYKAFVRRIVGMQWSGTMRLSPDADVMRQSYQAFIETKLGYEWEHMRDWGGKITGGAVRIAGLIHASETQGDPTATPISNETMIAATKIAEFLSAHAEAAYQMMGGDTDIENAKYILKRISENGKDELSRSEMKLLCRKLKSDDMQGAIDVLVEYRYLVEVQEDVGYNGRSKTLYFVNPVVLT